MNKAVSRFKAILQISGCCFFIFWAFAAGAQTRGKVEVIKDARIDTFAAHRLELNKGADAMTVNGFRVQIFTGENRKDAYNAQSKFLEQFPDSILVATCRRHQNHGKFNGSIEEQLAVLDVAVRNVVTWGFASVDQAVEMASARERTLFESESALRQKLDKESAGAAAAHEQVTALQASTSWRITAPLRAGLDLIRKLLGRS